MARPTLRGLAVAEPMGTWLKFSTPQATAALMTPEPMRLAATLVACSDEPHWVSTVVAGALWGRPAVSQAVRVTLKDCMPTWPRSPRTPDRPRRGRCRCARSALAASWPAGRRNGWWRAAVATPDGGAHGFDDHDFTFAHSPSLGQGSTGGSSRRSVRAGGPTACRGVGRLVQIAGFVGLAGPVTQSGTQGTPGVGHAPATDGSGGFVEAPRRLGRHRRWARGALGFHT